MLRHTCTTNFIECHPKAIVLQSAPFGLAIDILSGKGVAASSTKVYNFKMLRVISDEDECVIIERAAEMRLFLRSVLPNLSCYAIGTKKTEKSKWIVRLLLCNHHGLCSYEIQGEIKK